MPAFSVDVTSVSVLSVLLSLRSLSDTGEDSWNLFSNSLATSIEAILSNKVRNGRDIGASPDHTTYMLPDQYRELNPNQCVADSSQASYSLFMYQVRFANFVRKELALLNEKPPRTFPRFSRALFRLSLPTGPFFPNR